MNHHWLDLPAARPDEEARRAAERRQSQLTKPPGALGRLEALAIQLAALQGNASPVAHPAHIAVFAADHGVTEEGISAFPQSVTAEMVRNFARGGAAINLLAREAGASLEVFDLGTVAELEPLPGVTSRRIGAGSANFTRGPAMSVEQLLAALDVGREAAQRAVRSGARLFIGGEMGIGNTTSAAALACALLQAPAERLAGPGTGLDARGVAHKAAVIERGVDLHRAGCSDPLEALRRLGGFEIAALTGAYIACAQEGLPVLVDGFIASVAALAAVRRAPAIRPWLLFSHASAEPGHAAVIAALGATPLLDLGMRLGEGSGAAVALPLLRLACSLHNGMATFDEAGVSTRNGAVNEPASK